MKKSRMALITLVISALLIILIITFLIYQSTLGQKSIPVIPVASDKPAAVVAGTPASKRKSVAHLPLASHPQAPTGVRASIFDSADIVFASLQIKAIGSPDEKSFAADALRECEVHVSQSEVPESVRLQLEAVRATASPEIEAQKKAASARIDEQCAGFKPMSAEQRRELILTLKSSSKATVGGERSPHQTLKNIEDRLKAGDTRLSSVEVEIVSNSLHGDDALLRREAFGLLLASIDQNASSGKERREALTRAMSEEILNPFLTNFEAQSACSSLGLCSSSALSAFVLSGETSEAAGETARFVALYKRAFHEHAPYDKLAAIR